MFDIGGVELIVIAAVAILVVGPRELPGMLRGIGKVARQLREMTGSVQRQFNDALKEAELDDVKKTIDDVRSLNPATKIRQTIAKEMKPLTDVGDSVKSAVGQVSTMAKPDTKPTGTEADKAAKTASGNAAPMNAAPKAVESPAPGKKTAAPAKKPAARKGTAKSAATKSASKTAPAAAKARAPAKTGAARATTAKAAKPAATKTAAKTAPAAAKARAPVKTGAAKATAKSAPKSASKAPAKSITKAAPAKSRAPAKTGAARATAKAAPVKTGPDNGG